MDPLEPGASTRMAVSTNGEKHREIDCSPPQSWYVRPRPESQQATPELDEGHQPVNLGHTCHGAAGPQGQIQNAGWRGRTLGLQEQYVPHKAKFPTQEEFSSSSFLFSILFNIYKTFLKILGISLPSLIGPPQKFKWMN